jgi:hypothetical protein
MIDSQAKTACFLMAGMPKTRAWFRSSTQTKQPPRLNPRFMQATKMVK